MAASPRASRPPSGGALQVTAMKPGAHNDLFEEDPMSGENLTRLSDNALTYAAPGLFGVAGTAMAAGATVRFDVCVTRAVLCHRVCLHTAPRPIAACCVVLVHETQRWPRAACPASRANVLRGMLLTVWLDPFLPARRFCSHRVQRHCCEASALTGSACAVAISSSPCPPRA